MKKVFIDPGHGGSDPGATANVLKEKDICLAIALKMKDRLIQSYLGHSIKLSRTTDRALSLKRRTDMANQWKADYLISVHINAGGGTGFESYIYNGSYAGIGETDRLRIRVHDKIVRETGFKDRGKKAANFHMVRESAMPAMLTECGFIDHSSDAGKLKSDAFLNTIANGHVSGLASALGLTKKNDGPATAGDVHIVRKGDTLWQIARQENITVLRLLALNPGIVPERLQIGAAVRVR